MTKNQPHTTTPSGTKYVLVDYYLQPDNGYAGYAFQNVTTGKITVVHAGSAPLTPEYIKDISNWGDLCNDWIKTNFGNLGVGVIPSQFESADFFMSKMVTYCKNNNLELDSTNQSLGASLGQALGMLDKYKDINFTNYNPLGMKHFEQKLIDKEYVLSNDYSNITNLIAQNEVLSKTFEQAGNTYVATSGDTGSQMGNHFVTIHYENKLNYEKVIQPANLESKIKTFSTNLYNNISNIYLYAQLHNKLNMELTKIGVEFIGNTTKEQIRGLYEYLDLRNIHLGKIKTPDFSYNIMSAKEIESYANIYGTNTTNIESANPWMSDAYSDDKGFILIEDDQQITIPENVLRGSVTYSESFDSFKNLLNGTTKPEDIIDFQIPEDSGFSVPEGGKPQEITYQYMQAPAADAMSLTKQALIGMSILMNGNAIRFDFKKLYKSVA